MVSYIQAGGNMKAIDKDIVRRVAHLSRLSLDDKELDVYCGQLSAILSYISKLNEINTENVQPTSHAVPTLRNVFRKDVLRPSLEVENVLRDAPAKEGDYFKVPQIIEGK